MAFTDDMENIVKATGLTEDELASVIIAKEKEGWTNAEISDFLVSNFDNKEYASKAQNELDAIYQLGFNPPKDYNPAGGKRYQQWQEYKEDPSLFDRFKSRYAANKEADEQRRASSRESIANSVTDWRDSHPEQWRVGMVNSIFGDNSLLSQYYASKNAAEESEKNRQNQSEYNEYLREYDRANSQKEAEVELASLNRDLVKSRPSDAAVILKRREALLNKYPDLKSDESDDTAKNEYEKELKYKKAKIAAQRALPMTFATDQEKAKAIDSVYNNEELLDEHKEEIINFIKSQKSTAQLQQEARQSAIAGHSGKKTTESLDDSDLAKKTEAAIKSNKSPSRMTDDQRKKAKELGYTWKGTNWSK